MRGRICVGVLVMLSAADGETERRVAAAPAEQVEVWTKRVLSAATLAELLAD